MKILNRMWNWFGGATASSKQQKVDAQVLQDHDALIHLHQEQEQEIAIIFSHMQQSSAQMNQYIEVYQKLLEPHIDDLRTEVKDNNSSDHTVSICHHQMDDQQQLFIEDKRKLGILINERPMGFDFKKATHVDYQLFMDAKKVHHEKIKAQAELFFKSYEHFKSNMNSELIVKISN